jgi:hypothetical protein
MRLRIKMPPLTFAGAMRSAAHVSTLVFRLRLVVTVAAALLLTACASRPVRQFQAPPQTLVLQEKASRGTIHYPAGTYTFESEDSTGYYYRAPRSVRQHSFGGSYPHEGGIFVLKRDPQRIRGYIVLGNERRKLGNLSGVPHEFQ